MNQVVSNLEIKMALDQRKNNLELQVIISLHCFWHNYCRMLSMMRSAYIEVTVILVEGAKGLSRGAENGLLDSKVIVQKAVHLP